MFYPGNPEECRALARQYTSLKNTAAAPRNWIGGVVPHAGWICSAALAGEAIGTIGQGATAVKLVVIFGAIHTPIPTRLSALDSYVKWDLPGDACEIQQELRYRLLVEATTKGGSENLFCVDDRFHAREHAVEVELPLIRSVWPGVPILPIEVPPTQDAVEVGRATARLATMIQRSQPGAGRVIFLASSDLTHYGPNYDFAPAGVGPAAMEWAKQNDQPLLEKVLQLREEAIVPEVQKSLNACGAGAIAAMLAACKELGANRAELLHHATSYETLASVAPQPPENAVGYASIVVG